MLNTVLTSANLSRPQVPELALVELKVKDHSHSGKDHHLGSFAVRVADMQQGYRRAYLQDYTGKVLKPASLFLRIEKKFQKVKTSDYTSHQVSI